MPCACRTFIFSYRAEFGSDARPFIWLNSTWYAPVPFELYRQPAREKEIQEIKLVSLTCRCDPLSYAPHRRWQSNSDAVKYLVYRLYAYIIFQMLQDRMYLIVGRKRNECSAVAWRASQTFHLSPIVARLDCRRDNRTNFGRQENLLVEQVRRRSTTLMLALPLLSMEEVSPDITHREESLFPHAHKLW